MRIISLRYQIALIGLGLGTLLTHRLKILERASRQMG